MGWSADCINSQQANGYLSVSEALIIAHRLCKTSGDEESARLIEPALLNVGRKLALAVGPDERLEALRTKLIGSDDNDGSPYGGK